MQRVIFAWLPMSDTKDKKVALGMPYPARGLVAFPTAQIRVSRIEMSDALPDVGRLKRVARRGSGKGNVSDWLSVPPTSPLVIGAQVSNIGVVGGAGADAPPWQRGRLRRCGRIER